MVTGKHASCACGRRVYSNKGNRESAPSSCACKGPSGSCAPREKPLYLDGGSPLVLLLQSHMVARTRLRTNSTRVSLHNGSSSIHRGYPSINDIHAANEVTALQLGNNVGLPD